MAKSGYTCKKPIKQRKSQGKRKEDQFVGSHARKSSTLQDNLDGTCLCSQHDTSLHQRIDENYLSSSIKKESYSLILKKRRRQSMLKRAGVSILALLLVLFCVAGGYVLWYSNALNKALSIDQDQEAAIGAVLSTAEIGQPFYMLILGSDSREGSGTSEKEAESGDNQRSDVMILLRVDASNKLITMVSIPRDTPLTLENGSIVKINEAYNIGGAPYSIEAVENLTGVNISHYAEVHFSEFEQIVDKLGGVTVDVPVEVSYKDALTGEMVTIQPGMQTLDGQQAQIFARARKEYGSDQEAVRQSNVRTLVEAMADSILKKPLTDLPETVLDLASFVGTDLNAGSLASLAMELAGGSGDITMYSCTGPSSGDFIEEYDGQWLCYENPEGWATLMEVVDAGQDPSELDVESTAIIP